MSEIQDLKNHILALDAKVNNLLLIIQGFKQNNENINEIVSLIHNLGMERTKQNNVLFDTIYPDLIRRLNQIEMVHRKEEERNRKEYIHELLGKKEEEKKEKIDNEYLQISIEKLPFSSSRTLHCLNAMDIENIQDILKYTAYDFLKQPNLGPRTLKDIANVLAAYNLKIKLMDEIVHRQNARL